MSIKKPSDEKIGHVAPFGLRMLPPLKAQLEESARKSGRSLNAEIVSRLEASLGHASMQTDARIERLLHAFEEQQKVIQKLIGDRST